VSEYRGPITTALQFIASCRGVNVIGVGCAGSLCWIDVMANIDGTEEQSYFLMERRGSGSVALKVIPNLSSTEIFQAKLKPDGFWNHPRAHTPQHGDDSAW